LVRIGLVGCVKGKRSQRSRAKDLYTSGLFIKARRYVERCYDRWYILSAKYGLVDPETIIEPYDETLKDKSVQERLTWSERASEQIHAAFPDPSNLVLFFHAGERYREFLIPRLEDKRYHCEVPLKGLGIGEQKAWYKAREEKATC